MDFMRGVIVGLLLMLVIAACVIGVLHAVTPV